MDAKESNCLAVLCAKATTARIALLCVRASAACVAVLCVRASTADFSTVLLWQGIGETAGGREVSRSLHGYDCPQHFLAGQHPILRIPTAGVPRNWLHRTLSSSMT